MSQPFSRAGSAIGDRPVSGMRPMTGSTRVGTATSRVVPGTASRLLASAMQNRPASRAGIGLQTPVAVADRPVTQQGLSGMRTGTGKGPQRQYQDKSYFMGLLRTKMSELQSEIGKISREVEAANEEQSTFLAYDKRVKELAAELTESQGVLADYNLLVDKLNTDTDRADVEAEAAELRAANDAESKEVETLFAEKQEREKYVHQLELEIGQERNMADNLVSAMQPDLRDRYLQLKNQNMQFQTDLERMNQELDALNSRKGALEDELAMSQVKKEAVVLYDQLREVEDKRDQLVEEEKLRGTPAQERERLLQQVKDDNAEISTMERQITEMTERIGHLQEEQSHLDQVVEENQSERNQKYRELKKREETMDNFLASFEETQAEELKRIADLQMQIQQVTEEMSRVLSQAGNLPSAAGFSSMKDDLSFKQGEMEKSKNTLDGLGKEHGQLQMNLEKIEALEEKIKAEMSTLKEKMSSMDREIDVFSDLGRLRSEADEKRSALEEMREELGARRVAVAQNLNEAQDRHEKAKKQLSDNETHVQLTNLEKKWSHLEQNNFTLAEFVANRKAELDFEPVKNKVLKMQWEYNKQLVESAKTTTGKGGSA